MNDAGFKIIMAGLIVLGLLYSFTDIRIDPIFYDGSTISGSTTGSSLSSASSDESNPEDSETKTDIKIKRVRETRDMTAQQEEASRDYDPNFRGDEEKEYVVIEAPITNTHEVNVTGWKLENRWKTSTAIIGQAYITVTPNRTELRDIVLKPGDQLYVMSGGKPGRWFSTQLNICHGYFNHSFKDRLLLPIKNRCPAISDDQISEQYKNEQFCLEEIKDQRVCQPVRDVSSLASYGCYEYIKELYSYPTCVRQNYLSDNFQTGQWIYYLDEEDPLWNLRDDGLFLYNTSGKIVDLQGNF